MSTKHKVIAGFLLMMFLLGTVAVLGNTKLGEASRGFSAYQIESLTAVNTNGAAALTLGALGYLNRFRLTLEQSFYDDAMFFLERAVDPYMTSAIERETDPAESAVLKEQIAYIGQIGKLAGEMRQKVSDGTRLADEQLAFASQGITSSLQAMSEYAFQSNNISLLPIIDEAYRSFLDASVWGRHYVDIFLESSGVKAEQALVAFAGALAKMEREITNSEGRTLYAKLTKQHAEYVDIFKKVRALIDEGEIVQAKIDSLGDTLTESLDGYTGRAEDRMNTIGPDMQRSNARGKTLILVVSICGIIIGGLLALFIVMGFIKVINNVSRFASAIAGGDFNAHVANREKGEIGTMVHAMSAILDILKKLMSDTHQAADKIYVGHYRTRLDVNAFPGAYQDLTQSINMVSEAYTKTLDEIPLAIFTADRDYKMHYLNKLTSSILGGDKVGQPCGSCLKSDRCGKETCFAVNAMRDCKQTSGEMSTSPDGKNKMVLSVNALPLCDKAGALQGFMEICTDITDLKQVQQTIRNVADQAASITNRVASASEELSVQVAQVSHGAEMQRDRVIATSGAMTEMNAAVIEVAKNAGSASEQSENTRKKAQEGAGLVNQVMSAINAVNTIGQTLQSNIGELGAQAENIGNVLNVISDIADQTNLLALNAAIEAARAGEAGRGFAVVADEVRKLAEKTLQATQQVGDSIQAVQHSVRVNIDEVGKAVASVAEANVLATSSGAALHEIVSLASANSSIVASIATATEEQSATSEEIGRALEEINQIVSDTTEGMMQASAAVQDLSHTAQELRNVMEKL